MVEKKQTIDETVAKKMSGSLFTDPKAKAETERKRKSDEEAAKRRATYALPSHHPSYHPSSQHTWGGEPHTRGIGATVAANKRGFDAQSPLPKTGSGGAEGIPKFLRREVQPSAKEDYKIIRAKDGSLYVEVGPELFNEMVRSARNTVQREADFDRLYLRPEAWSKIEEVIAEQYLEAKWMHESQMLPWRLRGAPAPNDQAKAEAHDSETGEIL